MMSPPDGSATGLIMALGSHAAHGYPANEAFTGVVCLLASQSIVTSICSCCRSISFARSRAVRLKRRHVERR